MFSTVALGLLAPARLLSDEPARPADALAVHALAAHGYKASPQLAFSAFAPGNAAPLPMGLLGQQSLRGLDRSSQESTHAKVLVHAHHILLLPRLQTIQKRRIIPIIPITRVRRDS